MRKPSYPRTQARGLATSKSRAEDAGERRFAASRRDLAQVTHEQQVLHVRGDRGQVLERLHRLLAPLGVPGAQRGRQDLLQQVCLAVSRGAEHPQVAATHAEARKLAGGADDLAVGVVVEDLAL